MSKFTQKCKNSPPCSRPSSQLWTKWYHWLPGIQGHSVQRKGRVRHGQSRTDCLEEKGWDIGYQEGGRRKKKRALLKQVRKRAKAKGQTSKEGKAGEKNACRLVKPCFLSPLPHSSFNSLSLCLRGGQVCSDVDLCKKTQEQKEREWAGVPRGQMRWKCPFS